MNSTAEVLMKVKAICTGRHQCNDCPLDKVFCSRTPESWDEEIDISNLQHIIDNYEENKNDV